MSTDSAALHRNHVGNTWARIIKLEVLRALRLIVCYCQHIQTALLVNLNA